ncbi:hypothetical protein ACUODJ_10955, partial [Escherichia sp. HC-CC]
NTVLASEYKMQLPDEKRLADEQYRRGFAGSLLRFSLRAIPLSVPLYGAALNNGISYTPGIYR